MRQEKGAEYLIFYICILLSDVFNRVESHPPILCVPTIGDSPICPSTPEKMCIQTEISPDEYANVSQIYTAEKLNYYQSQSFQSAICKKYPSAVPIVANQEEFCDLWSCENSSECTPSFLQYLIRKPLCYDTCIRCNDDTTAAEYCRLQTIYFNVAPKGSTKCTSLKLPAVPVFNFHELIWYISAISALIIFCGITAALVRFFIKIKKEAQNPNSIIISQSNPLLIEDDSNEQEMTSL